MYPPGIGIWLSQCRKLCKPCEYVNLIIPRHVELLEEHEDLNEKLIQVENQRLRGTLDLLSSKMEVAKEFAVTKEIYKDMICSKTGSLPILQCFISKSQN